MQAYIPCKLPNINDARVFLLQTHMGIKRTEAFVAAIDRDVSFFYKSRKIQKKFAQSNGSCCSTKAVAVSTSF